MGNVYLALITVVYLGLVAYLGYRGYRATTTSSDYMLAGRQVHPFVMATSYGATFISTSAIIGFGGAASIFGMGMMWLTFLNIAIGIFIAFIVLGKPTRRMGKRLDAQTFPELLGKRFKSPFIQVCAGIIIVLFMPLYTGVVLMGAAKFLQVRFDMNYEIALMAFSAIVAVYVILGGLKGVMYVDALQGTIMFAGMALLLVLTYGKLGGVTQAHQSLTDLAPRAIETFGANGHQGWTAMPEFGSRFWWILVSTIIMGVGIGVLAQPQLAVRFMTVKSSRDLNRAVAVGGIFIMITIGVIYMVGALSNIFFIGDESIGAPAIAAARGDIEQIIPLFLKNYMPGWLTDIFLITLMSAAMSTASSQMHAMGSAAGHDIAQVISRGRLRNTILATRGGILVTFVMSLGLAIFVPRLFAETGTAIIMRGTAIFFGLCASTFLPMYFGGLFWRGITKAGAISGAIVGFVLSAVWLVFFHAKESAALKLCDLLFGKSCLVDGVRTGRILWAEVDPLFIAFPLAVITTVVVSFITRPMPNDHLDNCFAKQ